MDTYKCSACDDPLSDGAHCTVCKQQLHYHCAGLTEAGFRKLGDRRLTWRFGQFKQTNSTVSVSPRVENESLILKRIRALAEKLVPLECLKDEIITLKTEFAELKFSVTETNKELKEFNSKIKDIEARLKQVEKAQEQVNLLHTRLDVLEEDSNANEQWTRMNNIEIKGVPQTNNENLFEIVRTIGTKIHYPISKAQIIFVTRVATREKDHIKPIIVCFCNRYAKEDFIAAARISLKTAPLSAAQIGLVGNQRIYINDHLTIQNKLLLSKTKKAATEMDFRYVWVKHSKIHARKTDTSHNIVVKTEKDLAKIK